MSGGGERNKTKQKNPPKKKQMKRINRVVYVYVYIDHREKRAMKKDGKRNR